MAIGRHEQGVLAAARIRSTAHSTAQRSTVAAMRHMAEVDASVQLQAMLWGSSARRDVHVMRAEAALHAAAVIRGVAAVWESRQVHFGLGLNLVRVSVGVLTGSLQSMSCCMPVFIVLLKGPGDDAGPGALLAWRCWAWCRVESMCGLSPAARVALVQPSW